MPSRPPTCPPPAPAPAPAATAAVTVAVPLVLCGCCVCVWAGPQVCKYFLDAVEKEVYGWFWVCPNGGDTCKYRHALPTGYVYKSKAQRDLEAADAADKEVSSTIEEDIEKLVCVV